jgi:hypothetical protein
MLKGCLTCRRDVNEERPASLSERMTALVCASLRPGPVGVSGSAPPAQVP